MKKMHLLIIILFCASLVYSQDTARQIGAENAVAAYSYFDFTKTGFQPVFWASYDYKYFSIEARYNYDWDKNISIYIGNVLKYKNWKFRFMEGITSGKQTGLSISPLSIFDGKKIFFYNSPQVVFGISKMPTYFFHWGEIYYKPAEFFWFGLADRIYLDDETGKDISFGSQVSFAYKNLFINFYYWLPTHLTENRFSILLGYERSLKRQLTKK